MDTLPDGTPITDVELEKATHIAAGTRYSANCARAAGWAIAPVLEATAAKAESRRGLLDALLQKGGLDLTLAPVFIAPICGRGGCNKVLGHEGDCRKRL